MERFFLSDETTKHVLKHAFISLHCIKPFLAVLNNESRFHERSLEELGEYSMAFVKRSMFRMLPIV